MSRIADALKRAETGVAAPAAEPDADGSIQFFHSDQPPVSSPWAIAPEEGLPVAPLEPRQGERERSTATPLVQGGLGIEVAWPTHEGAEKLVVSPDVARMVRDQYNKLAAALHQAQGERGLRVVMVTSAGVGEGKTLTSVNLALTFSESYHRRVLLIDADLRRPMIHQVLALPNGKGLADSLTIEGPWPLVELNAYLSVLPAGQSTDDPMKTLTSNRMRELMEEARTRFDWVLVDTAPVGLLPDARLLASMADATLLVAQANKTSCSLIQDAAKALGPEGIFGVVLNRVAEASLSNSYYHDYYGARRN